MFNFELFWKVVAQDGAFFKSCRARGGGNMGVLRSSHGGKEELWNQSFFGNSGV